MSRHRDFDAARAEHQSEPLTFRLAGHDFETVPVIPAGPILDLAANADKMDADAMVAFARFLYSIVRADQVDAFTHALDTVDLGTVLELVAWVIEETTGRPLGRHSSLPVEPSTGGEPSRRVSLTPVESRSA